MLPNDRTEYVLEISPYRGETISFNQPRSSERCGISDVVTGR